MTMLPTVITAGGDWTQVWEYNLYNGQLYLSPKLQF